MTQRELLFLYLLIFSKGLLSDILISRKTVKTVDIMEGKIWEKTFAYDLIQNA